MMIMVMAVIVMIMIMVPADSFHLPILIQCDKLQPYNERLELSRKFKLHL